jgi:hypothetical protein
MDSSEALQRLAEAMAGAFILHGDMCSNISYIVNTTKYLSACNG